MKLDKTLNFKKVRCVKAYDDCLKIGKEYDVLDISVEIKVKDDDGEFLYWESDYFEPVLEPAENPLQDMKLTPELEAVEPVLSDNCVNIQDIDTNILDTNADIKDTPKFKVGDKVYFGVNPKIQTIESLHAYDNIKFIGTWGCAHAKQCCHATPENYERLQATFPDIEFEQPPKSLTGSDLARAMVDKGWFIIDCYVSAISDEDALRFRNKRMQVALFGDGLFTDGVKQFPFAVPFDSKTGNPLTESVLND